MSPCTCVLLAVRPTDDCGVEFPPPPLPYLGTVLYNILDAQDPHRFKISTEGPGMGWSQVQRMWVFPADLVREAFAMSPSGGFDSSPRSASAQIHTHKCVMRGCAWVGVRVRLCVPARCCLPGAEW